MEEKHKTYGMSFAFRILLTVWLDKNHTYKTISSIHQINPRLALLENLGG